MDQEKFVDIVKECRFKQEPQKNEFKLIRRQVKKFIEATEQNPDKQQKIGKQSRGKKTYHYEYEIEDQALSIQIAEPFVQIMRKNKDEESLSIQSQPDQHQQNGSLAYNSNPQIQLENTLSARPHFPPFRYVKESRKKKIIYVCKCRYQNHNLHIIRRHISKCKYPLQNMIKPSQAPIINDDDGAIQAEQIQGPQQESNNNEKISYAAIERLVENKIKQFTLTTSMNLKPLEMASNVYKMFQEGIKQSIITNLALVWRI